MVKKVIPSEVPQAQFITSVDVLGKLIKAKRTAMGITLTDCAALCNVGINTLSRIENGNDNCTLAAVFAVLRGLGIKLTSPSLSLSPFEQRDGSSVRDDDWV